MRIRNAAQAGRRFVNGSPIRRSGLIVAVLSLALLFGTVLFLDTGPSANASDSETAALIDDFNQYRESNSVAALSTSSSANADAQAGAEDSVQQCGYVYQANGHNVVWGEQGYETAAQIWAVYQANQGDPIFNYIGSPQYQSIGIGRAESASCNLGYIWVIILDTGGGPATTPPPTLPPTPTPAHTPIPTPTPATTTPTPTPTASPGPSGSPQPSLPDRGTPPPTGSPGGSATQTAIPSSIVPTPTPLPGVLPGDVDCGGTINMGDVLLLLETAAHVPVFAPCLGLAGVDCTGGVDAADALVLLEFLENIPYHLPDGCPPLGSPMPSPTTVPTQTAPATPGVMPIPAGINHCELAMVAYQLETAELLNGAESCTPGAGTAYDCVFSTDDHKAVCVASSSDFPDYTCSFATGFADCVPSSGQPEYQCFGNSVDLVSCIPAHTGYPWYDCAVSGNDVTCTSAAPAPNFECRHVGAEFSCFALASPTPTAPPG